MKEVDLSKYKINLAQKQLHVPFKYEILLEHFEMRQHFSLSKNIILYIIYILIPNNNSNLQDMIGSIIHP